MDFNSKVWLLLSNFIVEIPDITMTIKTNTTTNICPHFSLSLKSGRTFPRDWKLANRVLVRWKGPFFRADRKVDYLTIVVILRLSETIRSKSMSGDPDSPLTFTVTVPLQFDHLLNSPTPHRFPLKRDSDIIVFVAFSRTSTQFK